MITRYCTTVFLNFGIILLSNATIITVPPVDNSVCYGGVSTFYCESDSDDIVRSDIVNIQWSVDGATITDEEAMARGITINTNITTGTSTLYITGLPVNEGIITCIFVTDTFDVSSDSAVFTVTEIPSVNNVTIVFNDTIMSTTWSPPSCVPVNHSYIVTITNDSTTVTNTTTELYYTIPVSPCSSNYTVNITVIDVGFTQYQSTPTIEYGEKNNTQEIVITGKFVSFDGTEDAYITVYYQTTQTCTSIVQAIATIHSITPPGFFTDDIVTFDGSTGIGNSTIGPINKRFFGFIYLTTPENNEILNFSTYNVQNFTIQFSENGNTEITIFFARNSSADGCQVKLISMESSNEINFNITKTSLAQDVITEYMNIAPGEYGVSVHDIVNNVVNSNSSLEEHLISVPDAVISSSAVVTVVKSTMETSMSSGLSASLIEVMSSNPVGNEQSYTVVLVGSVCGAIVSILLVCVITIMIALKVRYKKIRSKQRLDLNSEIAYNQKNTAEPHIYHSVTQATVEIGRTQDDVSMQQQETQTTYVEDDDDFQFRNEYLTESNTDHSPINEGQSTSSSDSGHNSTDSSQSDRSCTPLLVHQPIQTEEKTQSEQVQQHESSWEEKAKQESSSSTPLLPPRSTNITQYQVIQPEQAAPILPPRSLTQTDVIEYPVTQHDRLFEPMEEETEQISNEVKTPPRLTPDLIRNSDGHILPSGPKLDQSQYTEVELKPKEERPKKRVNDSTHVYATFSNKDPPPLPPKQQNTTNHLKKSLKVSNNEQKSLNVFNAAQQENSRVYVSSVSATNEQYGAMVPSGSNEVIGIADYNYTSRNTENGADNQQYNNTVTSPVTQIPEMVNNDDERANCLELFYTQFSFFGTTNVFQSLDDNYYSKQDCYSEDSCCDSEQVDDSNNNNDILSEMVYTRTTFHSDILVSSRRVDHFIEISDVINFDAQANDEEVDTTIEDEIKEIPTYFSKIAVEKSKSVSVDPCTTLLPVVHDGVLPTLKNLCATVFCYLKTL